MSSHNIITIKEKLKKYKSIEELGYDKAMLKVKEAIEKLRCKIKVDTGYLRNPESICDEILHSLDLDGEQK
jgi:hypothetical protein